VDWKCGITQVLITVANRDPNPNLSHPTCTFSSAPVTHIFGRPFVKRFTLCYQTSVCLPVCDIGVLWRNGWVDQDETWHGDRPQTRIHCVRWDRAPPNRGTCDL